MSKQSKILRKDLKKEKKRAEDNFQDAAQEVLKLRGQLEKSKKDLKEAQFELKKLAGNPLPKLLVVVSAEVTGMVDLKSMKVKTVGTDSLAIMYMPPAITDSVHIRMSDTKRFLANNKKEGIFSSGEEGLYFEVYQQLKDAIVETESRVRKKAIEAGILEETDELAREYMRNVAKSMSSHAGFAENEPLELEEPQDTINSTSVKSLGDTLELIRKQGEQRDRGI